MRSDRLCTKMVAVTEDWYPPFKTETGSAVLVSIYRFGPDNHRVSVWGADDFGLELEGLDEATAFRLYDSIVDGVTQDSLRDKGFVNA